MLPPGMEITEEEITVSVKRLFTARFKLGMFDPEEDVPWSALPPDQVNGPEHRALARRAAQAYVQSREDLGFPLLEKDGQSA